jgi:superfamily II DNA or RNA helicase
MTSPRWLRAANVRSASATSYVGEGFDDPGLDTLVLAMPIAWKGTMTQYAGRPHRHHDAKHEIRIIDYVDDEVPVLRRMHAKRRRAYTSLGYRPAGASPRLARG